VGAVMQIWKDDEEKPTKIDPGPINSNPSQPDNIVSFYSFRMASVRAPDSLTYKKIWEHGPGAGGLFGALLWRPLRQARTSTEILSTTSAQTVVSNMVISKAGYIVIARFEALITVKSRVSNLELFIFTQSSCTP
jgi:hypothetical protein